MEVIKWITWSPLFIKRLSSAKSEIQSYLLNTHSFRLQRSKDAGGNDESAIKAQLNSLLYLSQIVQNKIKNANKLESENKMAKITLESILENNIAMSYFIDYLSSIKQQGKFSMIGQFIGTLLNVLIQF